MITPKEKMHGLGWFIIYTFAYIIHLIIQQNDDTNILYSLHTRSIIYFCLTFMIAGGGMFSEAYFIFSVGNLKPIWTAEYPDCWATHTTCNSKLSDSISYTQVSGIIFGQLALGFAADYIVRKLGSCLTAGTMLIFGILMTASSGATVSAQFAMFTAVQFLFGIGVGGTFIHHLFLPLTDVMLLEFMLRYWLYTWYDMYRRVPHCINLCQRTCWIHEIPLWSSWWDRRSRLFHARLGQPRQHPRHRYSDGHLRSNWRSIQPQESRGRLEVVVRPWLDPSGVHSLLAYLDSEREHCVAGEEKGIETDGKIIQKGAA